MQCSESLTSLPVLFLTSYFISLTVPHFALCSTQLIHCLLYLSLHVCFCTMLFSIFLLHVLLCLLHYTTYCTIFSSSISLPVSFLLPVLFHFQLYFFLFYIVLYQHRSYFRRYKCLQMLKEPNPLLRFKKILTTDLASLFLN